MSKETTQTLIGKLLPESGIVRDAIHIAVAPVQAATQLQPGQHIGFLNDRETTLVGHGAHVKCIGIVDPYIKRPVAQGEWFYMFLYPNTITSLSHAWEHPDFMQNEFNKVLDRMDGVPEAMEYMEKFASECTGYDYEDNETHATVDMILEGADEYLRTGEYLSKGGMFEGIVADETFWRHYETIRRVQVPEDQKTSFFSCSC